jgi:hypothetical protein
VSHLSSGCQAVQLVLAQEFGFELWFFLECGDALSGYRLEISINLLFEERHLFLGKQPIHEFDLNGPHSFITDHGMFDVWHVNF